MTISQTKNSAIDRTQENFSTVHGFTCRNCSRARRGPRGRASDREGRLAGALVASARCPVLLWTSGTAAVGESDVPTGVDVQTGSAGAPLGVPGAVEVDPQGVDVVGVD